MVLSTGTWDFQKAFDKVTHKLGDGDVVLTMKINVVAIHRIWSGSSIIICVNNYSVMKGHCVI